MHVPCTNYDNFIFKKEQTILIPAKYNHTYKKENKCCLPNDFLTKLTSKFFVKNEKKNKFDLNYERDMIQSLLLRILNINCKKIFPRVDYFPPLW